MVRSTHGNAHGGFATAAKRRGEQYVACACGVVSRSYRPEDDEAESFNDFARALLAFTFLMVAFIVFVYVMAAAAS